MDWISPGGRRYRAPYGANKFNDIISFMIGKQGGEGAGDG